MRYYSRFLIIAVICGGLCVGGYALSSEYYLSSEIVSLFGMSQIKYFVEYTPQITHWFLPLVFFQIFWGTYIYRHFCSASAYYFSRNKNRTEWYILEAAKLYMSCLAYLSVMLISGIMVCLFITKLKWDLYTIKVLFNYLMIYSLYLFVSTLCINIVSILFNSNIGFVLIEFFNFFFICAFTIVGNYFTKNQVIMDEYKWTIKINPFYYLVFNMLDNQSDYNFSIGLFFTLSFIFLLVGCVVINKYNFMRINQEI